MTDTSSKEAADDESPLPATEAAEAEVSTARPRTSVFERLARLTFAGRLTVGLVVTAAVFAVICGLAAWSGALRAGSCGPLSLGSVADNQPFLPSGRFGRPGSSCHTVNLFSDLPSLLLALTSAMSGITYLLLFSFLRGLPVSLVQDGLLDEEWLAALEADAVEVPARRPGSCEFEPYPAPDAPRVLLGLPLGRQIASWFYGQAPGQPSSSDLSLEEAEAQDRRCVADHLRTLVWPVPRRVSLALFALVGVVSVIFYVVAASRYYTGSNWWASWSAPFALPMVWMVVGWIGTYCALLQVVGYSKVMRTLDSLSKHSLATAPHHEHFRLSLQQDLSLVREGWRSARVMLNLKTVGFITFIPSFYAIVLIVRSVPGYPLYVAVILLGVLATSWRQFRITQAAANWHEREVQRAIDERRADLAEATAEGSTMKVLIHLHDLDVLRESFDFPRTRRRLFVSGVSNALLLLTGTAAAVGAMVPVLVSH